MTTKNDKVIQIVAFADSIILLTAKGRVYEATDAYRKETYKEIPVMDFIKGI